MPKVYGIIEKGATFENIVDAKDVGGAITGSEISSSGGLIAASLTIGGGSFTSASLAAGGVTDYSELTNIPNGIISSSEQLPSNIVSGSAQLTNTFLEITGDNVISSSRQFDSSDDVTFRKINVD